MSFFARLRFWLLPPYSVKTVLQLALTVLAICAVVLNGILSYGRISRETMAQARATAESVATLVASNNMSAYVFNDVEAIRFNLSQVVKLPGVDAIAIHRADGTVLAESRKPGASTAQGIGDQVPIPDVPEDLHTVDGRITPEFFETWVRVNAASDGRSGWVRVDYSMEQRRTSLEHLWHRSIYTLAATIAFILLLIPLILSWALAPIRRLSGIASNLSAQLGRGIGIGIDSRITEARALATALNKASLDVADQMARTQVIVNTAAVGIIGLDVQGRVVSANPATTSLFGREESELSRLPLEACIPGLTAQCLVGLFGEFADTPGRVYRIVRTDFHGTRRDGTRSRSRSRWVRHRQPICCATSVSSET